MDILGDHHLAELDAAGASPCVSIFLPTHRARPETDQDPIRLRNLLAQADERLRALGLRAPDAAELLASVTALLDQRSFWLHQADGLAIFVRPGSMRTFRLPLPFGELVTVGERFHLKPLLPYLAADGRFFVLALSQNQVRLLEGSRHSIDEVDLGDVPRSLADALHYEDPESHLLLHISGGGPGGPALFHGHGVGAEVDRERLVRFSRAIDRGLEEFLRGERAPLVLAGVERGAAIFREVSSYPEFADEVIAGSPEDLADRELHRRAWEIVEPRFRAQLHTDLERFRELDGTGLTASDVADVIVAARAGRAGVVFAAREQEVWGTVTADGIDVHDERRAGDEDLVDAAVVAGLRTGATIHVLGDDELPVQPLGAILRY